MSTTTHRQTALPTPDELAQFAPWEGDVYWCPNCRNETYADREERGKRAVCECRRRLIRLRLDRLRDAQESMATEPMTP